MPVEILLCHAGEAGAAGVLVVCESRRLVCRAVQETPGRRFDVGTAVQQVHPCGVDVSSGGASVSGKNGAAKVRAFIQNAKQAGN